MIETIPAEINSGRRIERRLFLWLVGGGAVGLASALVLTYEKFKLLSAQANGETLDLSCDFSAWVSCSQVVSSDQSAAFGFPNTFIGIVGFTVVVVFGVWGLSGSPLPRFMWAGLQGGCLFAAGFLTWLQFQSIYEIKALCPYCMVVWTVTIPMILFVTLRNLERVAPDSRVVRAARDWQWLILSLWYLAICGAIWIQFGARVFEQPS